MRCPLADLAVDDAHEAHDAAVGVVPGIEEERAQRRVGIALRRGDVRDDLLEDLVDADARLRRGQDGVVRVEADDVLDLLAHPLRLGRREVDLVDHREDVEVVVDGQVGVGQRLRLDALRGVDDENGALARGEAARDFVGEVDVARACRSG